MQLSYFQIWSHAEVLWVRNPTYEFGENTIQVITGGKRNISFIITGKKEKRWLCEPIDLVAGNLGVAICFSFSLKWKQNHQQRSQIWKFMFPGGGLKEALPRMTEKAGQGECQAALTSAYDNQWK